MFLSEQDKIAITAIRFTNNYWESEQDRIQAWVEDKIINQHMNERVEWDEFCEEFTWKYDEQPTFSLMVNELLGFMDSEVLLYFETTIKARFETIVDNIMLDIEEQEVESGEHERQYWKDVI